jgi:multiple sugar transport system substrate-binding protein
MMKQRRPVSHKLSRREFMVKSAGAASSVLLASCLGGSGGESTTSEGATVPEGGEYTGPNVTLDYWNGFTGGDGPVMQQLVKQFTEEHDNIQVKMNTLEWEDYYQNVPQAVTSGRGPDLGIMHIDTLATNAARQVIIPLDDVAESLELEEGDFASVVWNAGIYNDQRYGIPLDTHPLGMYYNKDVMEQAGLDPDSPPQTEEEYMSALEDLKSKGIEGSWVSPFLFTGGFMFESLVWQFGGELFNEDATEATFNSEEGVAALTWMVDLVKQGYSPKNVGQDADVIAFQNGKNAFNWNGIWFINGYGEVKDLNWGVAPLPQIGQERAAWANSHNFVIMNQRDQDENKIQAAKVLIAWISEHSIEWAKSGQVPARNTVRESDEFQSLNEQVAFAEQIDYLHFPPPVPGISDISPIIETGLNEAVLLKKEPQQALDDAAGQATQLLEENAEKYGNA